MDEMNQWRAEGHCRFRDSKKIPYCGQGLPTPTMPTIAMITFAKAVVSVSHALSTNPVPTTYGTTTHNFCYNSGDTMNINENKNKQPICITRVIITFARRA